MSEVKAQKSVTASMLSAKIEEAQKVLASIYLLRDNDFEVPSTLESQENKCRKGMDFMDNEGHLETPVDEMSSDLIQEIWIKFQGQRGRQGMSDIQRKIAFLDDRKDNIRLKVQKLANEYAAICSYKSDKNAQGTTYTFTLPKGTDYEEANGSALADKLAEIEGDYFAIFRKESETSRRGVLVGGHQYHSDIGSIDTLIHEMF